jgi:DNA-binding Xre family transcriptional regulator
MDETRQVVDALKRCLKMRGLTYRSLAERINLSEASVKRIFSERSFTLRRLEQVCGALEISVGELLRMVEHGRSRPTTLSLVQEEALARDPALLSFFYLLLNGWTEPDIQRGYEFERCSFGSCAPWLNELIESLPRGRHRLGWCEILWRKDGPYVGLRGGQKRFLRLISRRQISSPGSPPN